MNQTVFAGQDLDECAELEKADDCSLELVTGRKSPGQIFDSLLGRVACRTVHRRNIHRAILLDVNFGAGIGSDFLDCLAARSNDQANLLGFNVQRNNARRIVG